MYVRIFLAYENIVGVIVDMVNSNLLKIEA